MTARRPRRPAAATGDAAPRFDRKQAQLAAQVGRSLEQTLLGECADEVLQNLELQSVTPARGGRMLVTFVVHPPGRAMSRERVLARLEHARPTLVQHLARDLSRRALPELSFWLVRGPDADATGSEEDLAVGEDAPASEADEDPEDWSYDPYE